MFQHTLRCILRLNNENTGDVSRTMNAFMRLLNSIVRTVRVMRVCVYVFTISSFRSDIAHSNLIPSEIIKRNLSRSCPIVHVKYLHHSQYRMVSARNDATECM